jgi:hypothetical protein
VRGSGKTVLLNAMDDEARTQCWQVTSETAVPGLVTRLTRQRLVEIAHRIAADRHPSRLRSVSA